MFAEENDLTIDIYCLYIEETFREPKFLCLNIIKFFSQLVQTIYLYVKFESGHYIKYIKVIYVQGCG